MALRPSCGAPGSRIGNAASAARRTTSLPASHATSASETRQPVSAKQHGQLMPWQRQQAQAPVAEEPRMRAARAAETQGARAERSAVPRHRPGSSGQRASVRQGTRAWLPLLRQRSVRRCRTLLRRLARWRSSLLMNWRRQRRRSPRQSERPKQLIAGWQRRLEPEQAQVVGWQRWSVQRWQVVEQCRR